MPAPTGIDVQHVAHLARLALSPEEERKLAVHLGSILEYVEKLREVNIEGVEPTAHAAPRVNVLRADAVRPSLAQDEALRNAPAQGNGLFLVPKIVE